MRLRSGALQVAGETRHGCLCCSRRHTGKAALLAPPLLQRLASGRSGIGIRQAGGKLIHAPGNFFQVAFFF